MIGARAEFLAQQYLRQRGWRLIAHNWRCPAGEIDLVMDDPDAEARVLVEVRFRNSSDWGEPVETVDRIKQLKLMRAARYYQKMENYWGSLRFDVVGLQPKLGAPNTWLLKHVPHAFAWHR